MITVKVRVLNTPSEGLDKGWMVARLDTSYGQSGLWYYGVYDTEERADEVACELGNGVVLEVTDKQEINTKAV